MCPALDAPADAARIGSFSYLTASVEHSLYRNGKVLTRRDREGSDAEWKGVDLEPRDMPVHDARRLEGTERRTLAANGFEVLASPLADPDIDFFDNDRVARAYYPHLSLIHISEPTRPY